MTNIGDSIYYVAAMWLVYKLGGSTIYTGLAGFLILLPASMQFITGPFIDRWPAKRTLVITQLMQIVTIMIIPAAYYFDYLTVSLILVVMPIVSFINQFSYPSQIKVLSMILTKKELIKGNSYFSFAYQGVDLVFNAVSGILVAFVGAITLYLIDSIIFATAAILFSILKFPQVKNKKVTLKKGMKYGIMSYVRELKEGVVLVFGSLVSSFLIGSIVANFAIGGALAILPDFSERQGGAGVYGFYLAAMSIGGLTGALLSSWMGKFRIGTFIIYAFFISSIFWTASAILPWSYINIVLFAIAWVPIGGTNVLFAATIQSIIPNDILGRVNTVTTSLGTLAMPLGSLVGGWFAAVSNSMIIYALTGIGLAMVAVVCVLHPRLKSLPKAEEITPERLSLPFQNKTEHRSEEL